MKHYMTLALFILFSATATPALAQMECPPGYSFCSCGEGGQGVGGCIPNGSSCQDACGSVPEMELMMVPAAMGAAGFLAYRARKKARSKGTTV